MTNVVNHQLFTQSYFHEFLNGILFMLALWAVILFAAFLWVNRRDGYWESRPALALLGVFVGELIVRSTYWTARHLTNTDQSINDTAFYIAAICGGCMVALGMVCCMRVFAPKHCGPFMWVSAVMTAILWNVYWMGQYFW